MQNKDEQKGKRRKKKKLNELKKENVVGKKVKEQQSKVTAKLGFETSSPSMLAAILGICKHRLMVIAVIDNLNF